jgi:hypothetical protein
MAYSPLLLVRAFDPRSRLGLSVSPPSAAGALIDMTAEGTITLIFRLRTNASDVNRIERSRNLSDMAWFQQLTSGLLVIRPQWATSTNRQFY